MNASSKRTVVITGASAGIGRALAHEFARRGYDLGLTARRLAVLEETRSQIRAAHPDKSLRIELAVVDVDQEQTVAPALHALFLALGGVDIVVANAGVNAFTRVGRGDLAKETQVIRTNLIGAIATVNAAAEHFLARKGGQIVGISSLASLQGIPTQAAYCASKAGFSMYLDAARIELKRKNIRVTKIVPGFVKTEIMPNVGKYPFATTAELAAREIVTLVEKGRESGLVPAFPWKWLRPLLGHLPDSVWEKLR